MVEKLNYHNSNPRIGHLYITKQVLRYLKKTITLDIEWENNPAFHQLGEKYEDLGIVRYVDSKYAANLEDKKLIIGYCFFFSRAIVTWYIKRQRIVLTFTLEVKYVAMSKGARKKI